MNLGHFILILALVSAGYSIWTSIVGVRKNRDDFIKSGENALYAVTLLLTLVALFLWKDILSHNFQNVYATNYSNRTMPTFYALASFWGGQKGSLLFWGWLLSLYSTLAVYVNRNKNRELMPYVVATLMLGVAFFLLLNVFISQPFEKFWQLSDGSVIQSVLQPVNSIAFFAPDGRGLNPLLQHPAMAIHPPILYLGFVGFSIPFAFAVASLITGRLNNQWLKTIRRWTLVPWFFLGIGMLLGGKWAYMELGWGGYWAWDPVENAALMPWLVGTAFIHSVMIQEKKNMLRVWNMALILGTYILCIFGTFLTRSGVISSVHSFARSDIAQWFVGYLVLLIAGSVILILYRLPDLKNKNHFDSVISRESAFLINNFIFLGALLAVLWGTVFPLVTEAIRDVKISVAAPWFNSRMVPIGLLLLLLTGIGPLVAWRKTSSRLLKKIFLKPTLVSLACVALMFFLGIRHFYALISLTLSIFVTLTIVAEFHRGARARMRTNDEGYFEGMLRLLQKNKRRYGGYIVHFGMVVMFVGFTGKAFDAEKESHLKIGESMQIRDYTLKYIDTKTQSDATRFKITGQSLFNLSREGVPEDILKSLGSLIDQEFSREEIYFSKLETAIGPKQFDRYYDVLLKQTSDANKVVWQATMDVYKGDEKVKTIHPNKHYYIVQQQPTTEVVLRSTLLEDLYVVLAQPNEDKSAIFKVYVNPLVNLVWIAGLIVTIGTFIILLPDKTVRSERTTPRRARPARARQNA
ncbi:MAG: heme lyase CcmF/NrfE family subunit [bacterium]